MKLTKKQRDEVVMILRCAADVARSTWFGVDAIAEASVWPDDIALRRLAERAYFDVLSRPRDCWNDLTQYCLLEAALLVEEGVLP